MDVSTIQELDDWMTANCYNDSYEIGSRKTHEGYGLTTIDGLYVWYYTERGVCDYLHYFQTEQEAVDFAFKAITTDKTANRHLVGFMNDRSMKQELVTELDKRGITYWQDKIPFGGLHDPRTRIFVLGCDIQRALDLQEKYGISRMDSTE